VDVANFLASSASPLWRSDSMRHISIVLLCCPSPSLTICGLRHKGVEAIMGLNSSRPTITYNGEAHLLERCTYYAVALTNKRSRRKYHSFALGPPESRQILSLALRSTPKAFHPAYPKICHTTAHIFGTRPTLLLSTTFLFTLISSPCLRRQTCHSLARPG